MKTACFLDAISSFRFRRALVALLGVGALSSAAFAQEYPSHAIRIVVPFPPGSSADVQARQIANALSEQMKQTVMVDNRPGANGILGAAHAAKAKPDGYTLLYATSHVVAVNPHITKDLGFDPLNDLVPITITGSSPTLLVVNPNSSYRSVKDLIEAAKKSPGKLTYGTSGEGSPQHIMGERLEKTAGIQLLRVPYKGESFALQDLLGGRIDFCFGFPAGTMPLVQGGKLTALAVTSGKRLTAFSNIPTMSEEGVSGYAEVTYGAYMVPRGTPPDILKKLNEQFRVALMTLKEEIAARGAELIASSSEEAATLLKAEYVRYGKIVKDLGIEPQ